MSPQLTSEQALLLQTAVANIEQNPRGWDQGRWCMCFAAHVAVAAGAEFVTDVHVVPPGKNKADAIPVWRYAEQVAGLDYAWAKTLFDGENTLPYLRRWVDYLTENVPQVVHHAPEPHIAGTLLGGIPVEYSPPVEELLPV